MNNYARNFKVATQKAATVCNVPVEIDIERIIALEGVGIVNFDRNLHSI